MEKQQGFRYLTVLLISVVFASLMTGCEEEEHHKKKAEKPYDHRTDTKKKISYDPKTVPGSANEFTVISWNDLGIHCMDDDFSISSTLPPFQTLWAQVIHKTDKGPVRCPLFSAYLNTGCPCDRRVPLLHDHFQAEGLPYGKAVADRDADKGRNGGGASA